MTYYLYDDNREAVADYVAGVLHIGDDVVYRNQVCEILYEFTDTDSVKYLALLFKGGLGGNIQFQFM